MDLIIKLINTVAIPKIAYAMNFTSTSICKTFRIPTFIPNQFWYSVKQLKSIKDINYIRYHTTIIDRSINSPLQIRTFPSLHNHITTTTLISSYLPPISLLLNNLQIQIQSHSSTPTIPPQIILHKENTLEIFTDASLHLKSSTGNCAIYIPKINFKLTFPPHLPASSTHLELQSILKALLLCRETNEIHLFTDSLSAISAISNFNQKSISNQLKSSN